MVIKNKTKLRKDLPTVEETTSDMEQHTPKTTTDSPTIEEVEENS